MTDQPQPTTDERDWRPTALLDWTIRTNGRRTFLKGLGAGAALPFVTGTTAADSGAPQETKTETEPEAETTTESEMEAEEIQIDPYYGYSSPEPQDLSETSVSPAQTVELHIEEEFIEEETGDVNLGAFHFAPVGLHVQPGEVVQFDFVSPDHTVTAFHAKQGREQRIPQGVPPFSSPVISQEGFWLYEFTEPGVYDVLCAPHEVFGMVMRIVVGDTTDPVVTAPGRPPAAAAADVLDNEGLAPNAIVDASEGAIGWEELFPHP